jgi:hypothetical protein
VAGLHAGRRRVRLADGETHEGEACSTLPLPMRADHGCPAAPGRRC